MSETHKFQVGDIVALDKTNISPTVSLNHVEDGTLFQITAIVHPRTSEPDAGIGRYSVKILSKKDNDFYERTGLRPYRTPWARHDGGGGRYPETLFRKV